MLTPVRHREGRFIWCAGEAKPYHCYLFARRGFELAGKPGSARLHVTASDRYLLFVNGTYIGRGPARSDPRRKSYDTYDVAEHLQPGSNAIAVRAYHFGTPTRDDRRAGADPTANGGWGTWSGNSYTVGERAGLWAELEITTADGSTEIVGTDDSWRVCPARGWNRDVDLVNTLVGSNEVYDAGADPVDWMAIDFDESGWEAAWVVPQRELEWFLLEAREIPLLREREVFPARVVTVGEVIDMGHPGQTDIPELLNQEIHFPLEHAVSKDPEALLRNDGRAAEFRGRCAAEQGIRAPYLILDFGRQLFGFPRVRLRAEQGAILDLTYGQQLQAGRIPAAQRYGDRYIARDGEQTWEVAEYRQFRYLHLTLRSAYAPVLVESVSVNEYTYPAEQRGRFECSDPLLTKLWQACVDTTYLNIEDTMVHESYRERSVWATGDGSHGMHVVFAAFGALPLIDRFLRMFPLSDRGDGMLKIAYPPDIPTRHIHGQFLLQWSTRVREHYLFTGRRWVLEELYRSVPPQIDWFEPHRDELGLLRDLPGWNMIDWASVDFRGASFITNALYVAGLEDAAWLADQVGATVDAERWRAVAAEVRSALRRVFWNEAEGYYEDAYYQGGLTGVVSELANAMALLYDIASEDQTPRIGRRLSGADRDLVQATPLVFGYVVDGLMKAGLTSSALDLVRTRFGPMMESTDNPTIWELWGPFTGGYPLYTDADYLEREREHRVRPANVRSLAHTGGVQTGYVMSKRLLGVIPTGPGFATCTIHPHTGDLEWVRGTFPALQGDIRVEWERADGKLSLRVEVPDGIEAEVVLDRDPRQRQTLSHDGVEVGLDETERAAQFGVAVESALVRIRAAAGTHRFELSDVGDGR